MVEAMRYCHDYQQEPGTIDDYLNLAAYSELHDTDIILHGVDLGIKFLNCWCDIAYLVMLNDVELFEQAASQKSTCWPIMAQNLNLPASECAKLCNHIPLGVIPGPNQLNNFNLFLVPFVEEALNQAHGVETYNVMTSSKFTLHTHLITIYTSCSPDHYFRRHASD
jgi:hypothetical protein